MSDNYRDQFHPDETGTFSSSDEFVPKNEKKESPAPKKSDDELFSHSPAPRHFKAGEEFVDDSLMEEQEVREKIRAPHTDNFDVDNIAAPPVVEPTRVMPSLDAFDGEEIPEEPSPYDNTYGDAFESDADAFEAEDATEVIDTVTPRKSGDPRSSKDIARKRELEKKKKKQTIIIAIAVIISVILVLGILIFVIANAALKGDKDATKPTATESTTETVEKTEEEPVWTQAPTEPYHPATPDQW